MNDQKFRLSLTVYRFDGSIPKPTNIVFSGSSLKGLRRGLSLLTGAADDLWNPEEDPGPKLDAEFVPDAASAEAAAVKAPPTAGSPTETSVKGLTLIRCPDCEKTFVTFFREPTKEVECSCGRVIQLSRDDTARFESVCPTCKKITYGRTNLTDAIIEAGALACVCGVDCPEMRWDPVRREYHD